MSALHLGLVNCKARIPQIKAAFFTFISVSITYFVLIVSYIKKNSVQSKNACVFTLNIQ